MHLWLTLATLGVWGVCLLSAAAKRWIWPWRCEHCGWHEPDFRSPAEREAGRPKPKPRSGQSGSLRRLPNGEIVSSAEYYKRGGK